MNLNILKNGKGFSLLEIVITIIILGISLTAILESFIAGSAASVRIANEITATNLAKQYMADLNYCSEGGSVINTAGNTNGVCSNFNAASSKGGSSGSIWSKGATIDSYIFQSPQVQQINNECFYTAFYPSGTNEYPTQYITLNDPTGFNSGDVTINPSPISSPVQPQADTSYILLAVVKTEWFNNNVDGGNCTSSFNPSADANYPSVTLTMIFTNYYNTNTGG
ncbi:MAG: prepilin-type N-terminal cleavage/methylation domain-containing protein [Candidatus Acididesulfobacter guangdongensis]|uniref:Prepilin-type N-terminal cleavage/methylation domain-containing protein n=1 Tax=Acididesulfobacter guangdongensis TaxID=2597225 RepID=A0A519BFB8_ACIG2|nr:MAG: prepilin-type N-terminal cleavage/methylation domain-containing protein [Candidatus Acididesulfobacter guangdongensis]